MVCWTSQKRPPATAPKSRRSSKRGMDYIQNILSGTSDVQGASQSSDDTHPPLPIPYPSLSGFTSSAARLLTLTKYSIDRHIRATSNLQSAIPAGILFLSPTASTLCQSERQLPDTLDLILVSLLLLGKDVKLQLVREDKSAGALWPPCLLESVRRLSAPGRGCLEAIGEEHVALQNLRGTFGDHMPQTRLRRSCCVRLRRLCLATPSPLSPCVHRRHGQEREDSHCNNPPQLRAAAGRTRAPHKGLDHQHISSRTVTSCPFPSERRSPRSSGIVSRLECQLASAARGPSCSAKSLTLTRSSCDSAEARKPLAALLPAAAAAAATVSDRQRPQPAGREVVPTALASDVARDDVASAHPTERSLSTCPFGSIQPHPSSDDASWKRVIPVATETKKEASR